MPERSPSRRCWKRPYALVTLDYPHDTWVLDEGDEDRVKALCLRLGAKHFSRKNLSHYQTDSGLFQSRSKHGNYNAWLYEIGFKRYDIITAFDPDHVPQPCFSLPGTRVFRRSVRGVRAGCPSLLQPKRQFHRRRRPKRPMHIIPPYKWPATAWDIRWLLAATILIA